MAASITPSEAGFVFEQDPRSVGPNGLDAQNLWREQHGLPAIVYPAVSGNLRGSYTGPLPDESLRNNSSRLRALAAALTAFCRPARLGMGD